MIAVRHHNIPTQLICRDLIYQIRYVDVMNHVPTNGWGLMKNPKLTLGKIVCHYKARVTKFIHDAGYNDFRWQSRYYEHVLRNEKRFQ